MSRLKRSLRLAVITFSVVGLIILGAAVQKSAQPSLFIPQPVLAQSPIQGDFSKQVYQKLPDLPLENQYVSKETGKAAVDNTLLSRLIRYHVYVKGRPQNYRLDWKLTLADYLGANEVMEEKQYPGYDTLRKNPLEGDRAAIGRLNRQQRDALVQTLVSIFNPNNPGTPAASPNTAPQPTATPSQDANPLPQQPSSGAADLLKP